LTAGYLVGVIYIYHLCGVVLYHHEEYLKPAKKHLSLLSVAGEFIVSPIQHSL
jgi:biotin transporter BioY